MSCVFIVNVSNKIKFMTTAYTTRVSQFIQILKVLTIQRDLEVEKTVTLSRQKKNQIQIT